MRALRDRGLLRGDLPLHHHAASCWECSVDLKRQVDDVRGAGQEEDVRLGPQEDDQGARSCLGGCRRLLGRRIGVRSRLRSLGQEALGGIVGAVVGSTASLGGGLRCAFDGKPGQQRLYDPLFLNLEAEGLAHNAAARPDDVVFGGDELVGRAQRAVVGISVPDIVALGAIVAQDGLGHQILQRRGLVDADRAKGGHAEARVAL
jgi:hypothetical protein